MEQLQLKQKQVHEAMILKKDAVFKASGGRAAMPILNVPGVVDEKARLPTIVEEACHSYTNYIATLECFKALDVSKHGLLGADFWVEISNFDFNLEEGRNIKI